MKILLLVFKKLTGMLNFGLKNGPIGILEDFPEMPFHEIRSNQKNSKSGFSDLPQTNRRMNKLAKPKVGAETSASFLYNKH